MSLDMSEFHGIFFEESFEALDAMESGLLNLDLGAADEELINTIFRGAHSIKGGAGMFGFTEVVDLTHVLETLLDQMRNGTHDITQQAVDLMLQSVDCLREMLGAVQSQADIDKAQVASLCEQLNALLGAPDNSSAEAPAAEATPSVGSDTRWRICFKPHPNMLRSGNDPYRLFHELRELGDLEVTSDISNVPAFAELIPDECHLSWELQLVANVEQRQIAEIFDWVEGDCELSIEAVKTEPVATTGAPVEPVVVSPAAEQRSGEDRRTGAERRTAKAAETSSGSDSIRVGIDKIDSIVNLVGELVITQSMLSRFGESFVESETEQLREGLNQLARHTRELQESVLQIRMLPVSFSFNRFPRLVRDLSNKLGKKIELKLQGEQTELDKTVLEKIGDPLVHLVRNSLDHGIEMPEARLAAGKPEQGQILLNAFHMGGDIIIEVTDAGAGLPADKILKKALERGIVSDSDELSDEQIRNLIFAPGFSTAEQVSDVSRRGVGMDVVKRNIKDLGGSVEVRSEMGKGSTFSIRLPLTLAILDGQLVSVGSETYIISLVSIVESLQISPELVNSIAGKAEVYRVRDKYMPVIRLQEVCDVEPRHARLEDGILVVVEAHGMQVGLFVDALLGQQQVVIKSLETNFRQIEGLSGATILGDGTVALILDVPGIIARSLARGDNSSPTDMAAA